MAVRNVFQHPILAFLIGAAIVAGSLTLTSSSGLTLGTGGPSLTAASGDPSGTTKPIGSLRIRTDTGYLYRNTDGAAAWSVVGDMTAAGLFPYAGHGWDGNCVFDGSTAVIGYSRSGNTYTATGPASCADASVSSAVTVITCGYPLSVGGTLSGSGVIGCPGNNASGTSGGARRAAGALPGGGAGAAGAINFSSTSNAEGGNYFPSWCGVGGTATTSVGVTAAGVTNTAQRCMGGGGGARPTTTTGQAAGPGGVGGPLTTHFSYAMDASAWYLGVGGATTFGHQAAGNFGPATGGGGGAAASNGAVSGPAGGGGGGAAGWTTITAKRCTFTGRFVANGGTGAAGPAPTVSGANTAGGGGGGGGAGNMLYVVCGSGVTYSNDATTVGGQKACAGAAQTYCVSGGAGGAAGAANGVGSAPGTAGIDGGDGWAVILNVTGQS